MRRPFLLLLPAFALTSLTWADREEAENAAATEETPANEPIIVPAEPVDPIRALREREAKVKDVFNRVSSCIVALGSADQQGQGWGSGVIVNESGLILTAGHVTEATGKDVIVFLEDGREMPAKALGANMNRDAAMVQIIADESVKFPFVDVAEANTAELGDWVVAMGHPGGYDPTRPAPLRVGRIIQKQKQKLLVTDCTLSGGDSGGALFDLDGRLIGINSSIAQSLSHNIHVAIAVFHKDWERLQQEGESWGKLDNLFEVPLPGYESRVDRSKNRALLGASFDTRGRNGVLVKKVRPGFPADEAGLRSGDVVIKFNGKKVSSYKEDFFPLLAMLDPGDEVALVVERRGKEIELEVTMGDRDELLGE